MLDLKASGDTGQEGSQRCVPGKRPNPVINEQHDVWPIPSEESEPLQWGFGNPFGSEVDVIGPAPFNVIRIHLCPQLHDSRLDFRLGKSMDEVKKMLFGAAKSVSIREKK